MKPKKYVTFVYKNIEITIGVFTHKSENAQEKALAILIDTVSNPLDYKIKTN